MIKTKNEVTDSESSLYRPFFPATWEDSDLYSLATWLNGMAFRDFQFTATGKPVIKIAEIKNGITGQTKFTQSDYDSAYYLKPGDMLFAWSGQPDTSIDVYWWRGKEGWLNQHIFKVAPSPKCNPSFFYYLLKYLKPTFISIASNKQTTGLGHVTVKDLNNLLVRVPDIDTQESIAGILGALDDKIEVNRRMNATLESMARAIFKSWFVDFDIVHAKAVDQQISNIDSDTVALFPDKFIDSQLGKIPLGWKITPLYEVCKRITDGSHNSPKSVINGYPMASVKDMHNWGFNLATCRQISESDYLELVKNDCRPLQGDVLIAKDGSYLKHIFVIEKDLDLVVLSSIAILRPNEKVTSHFLALTLQSPTTMSRMENYVTGAVLQRIVVKDFRQFPILLPPYEIQMTLAKFIAPIMQKCWRNIDEINTLASLRDGLLPKLMRGEVKVKYEKPNS